jgi:ParB/RepB/Spo0J family partition protein
MKQALVADQIERVAITNLRIASWNARKTFDPAGLEELELSIKAHGIQVPLIARPVGAVLEIVAGHRRFYAGLALWEKGDEKFEHLPCIVRELNDDQAREIGLVDNLQREDVPPLEEADAYAELRTRLGSLEAIATRVNKQASYVARRLQLVTLGVHSRRAVDGKLISIDHALILARLGGTDQDEHLKWCLDTNAGIKTSVEDVIVACEKRVKEASGGKHFGYWEPQSVLDLKDHIESYAGRKLSRAPWKLDDAELVPEVWRVRGLPVEYEVKSHAL